MALAMVDSAAVFQRRLKDFGLLTLKEKMDNRGWKTFGSFAFATVFVPGAPTPPESVTKDIVEPLLGDRQALPNQYFLEPNLRRLHFEAYLYLMKDMQNKKEKTEDDIKPTKLPAPERSARFDAMKLKYTGLDLDQYEPSNLLVGEFATIHMNGEMRFVKWEELTSRADEHDGVRAEELFKTDSAGALKRIFQAVEAPADTSSEMKLWFALKRRGVALEMSDLCGYMIHDQLINFYFKAINEEPTEDYYKVTVHQVWMADKEIFKEIARATRSGFEPAVAGKFPLDDLLLAAMKCRRVDQLMAAKQKPVKAQGSAEGQQKRSRQEESLASQLKKAQADYQKLAGKGKGRGKGQTAKQKPGKSSATKREIRLPKELIGLSPTWKGQRICFSWNLDGCDKGEQCAKGVHRCMKCGSERHGQRKYRPNEGGF